MALGALTMPSVFSTVKVPTRVGRMRRSGTRLPRVVRIPRAHAGVDEASTVAADVARPGSVALPRRGALTVLACALAGPATLMASTTPMTAVRAAEGDAFTGSTREYDFKTYKLTVPDVYEEVNVPLKDPATGVVSPTVMLLKDTRVGQAGNTISLSKQTVPEGGIKSVADIGSPRETGERLVAAESARKKGVGGIGGAGASFRSASQRTGPGGLLYYTVEYTKTVLSVGRVVLTTLVVADGVLYTLTAEEDQGRFDGEMGDALKAADASFQVIAQTPMVTAPAPVEKPTKDGRRKR